MRNCTLRTIDNTEHISERCNGTAPLVIRVWQHVCILNSVGLAIFGTTVAKLYTVRFRRRISLVVENHAVNLCDFLLVALCFWNVCIAMLRC